MKKTLTHSSFIPKNLSRSLIPLLIVCVFFLNITLVDYTYAQGNSFKISGNPNAEAASPNLFSSSEATEGPLDISSLVLPEYLGQVKKSNIGNPRRILIHVQDAHCNYAAQKRVADILGYFSSAYGLKMINLEGGAGQYDLRVFSYIVDKQIREKVADYFVQSGELNGAEYFAVQNADKVKLWGIEEPRFYEDGLAIYRGSLTYVDKVRDWIGQMDHIISQLRRKIYSDRLFSVNALSKRFRKGDLDFEGYLNNLVRLAKERGIDIDKIPDLKLLSQAQREEKLIELEDMARNVGSYRAKRLSSYKFHAYLMDKVTRAGMNMDPYPNLDAYIGYIRKYERVNKPMVIPQLRSLEGRIKETLFENDKQRQLDTLSQNLDVLERFFDVQLSKEEYETYLGAAEHYSVQAYIDFINRESPAYGIQTDLDPEIRTLDKYVTHIAAFYQSSFKRDEAFLRHIKFSRISDDTYAAILVTGGFHTENLCKKFKAFGISYVSILPAFENKDNYVCPYFRILSGGGNNFAGAIESVLASMQVASLFTRLGYETDPRAAEFMRIGVLALGSMYQYQKLTGKDTLVIEIEGKRYLVFEFDAMEPVCRVVDKLDGRLEGMKPFTDEIFSNNTNGILRAFGEITDTVIAYARDDDRVYLDGAHPVIGEVRELIGHLNVRESSLLESRMMEIIGMDQYVITIDGKSETHSRPSGIQAIDGLVAAHAGAQGIYVPLIRAGDGSLDTRAMAYGIVHELIAGTFAEGQGLERETLNSHGLARAVESALRGGKPEEAADLAASAIARERDIWAMTLEERQNMTDRDYAAGIGWFKSIKAVVASTAKKQVIGVWIDWEIPEFSSMVEFDIVKTTYHKSTGLVHTQTFVSGHIEEYAYEDFHGEEMGRMVRLIRPDGSYIVFKEYHEGTRKPRIVEEYNSDGALVTSSEYDANGHRIEVVDSSGKILERMIFSDLGSTILRYYPSGNLRAQIDGNGSTYVYADTPKMRIVEWIEPDGTVTLYDDDGAIAEVIKLEEKDKGVASIPGAEHTAPEGGTIEYYPSGKVAKKTDADGVTFEYDEEEGYIRKMILPDGNITEYDKNERIIKKSGYSDVSTEPGGAVKQEWWEVTYEYYEGGWIKAKTWHDGTIEEFAIGTDYIVRKVLPDGSVEVYDNGKLVKVMKPGSDEVHAQKVDAGDQPEEISFIGEDGVTEEEEGFGGRVPWKVKYAYHDSGNLKLEVFPDGIVNEYEDSDEKKKTRRLDPTGSISIYDNSERLIEVIATPVQIEYHPDGVTERSIGLSNGVIILLNKRGYIIDALLPGEVEKPESLGGEDYAEYCLNNNIMLREALIPRNGEEYVTRVFERLKNYCRNTDEISMIGFAQSPFVSRDDINGYLDMLDRMADEYGIDAVTSVLGDATTAGAFGWLIENPGYKRRVLVGGVQVCADNGLMKGMEKRRVVAKRRLFDIGKAGQDDPQTKQHMRECLKSWRLISGGLRY